ncbi:hypothetical protein VTO42DRAFT_4806 [Malbranchea cinnamomea]
MAAVFSRCGRRRPSTEFSLDDDFTEMRIILDTAVVIDHLFVRFLDCHGGPPWRRPSPQHPNAVQVRAKAQSKVSSRFSSTTTTVISLVCQDNYTASSSALNLHPRPYLKPCPRNVSPQQQVSAASTGTSTEQQSNPNPVQLARRRPGQHEPDRQQEPVGSLRLRPLQKELRSTG